MTGHVHRGHSNNSTMLHRVLSVSPRYAPLCYVVTPQSRLSKSEWVLMSFQRFGRNLDVRYLCDKYCLHLAIKYDRSQVFWAHPHHAAAHISLCRVVVSHGSRN